MPGEHPSSLSGVFGQPFAEQVAFFRQKMGNRVPTRRWTDLQGEAHDTAFMVAGAAEADLLTDLAGAVDKAISEGRGIEEFRRDFRSIVAKNGWTGWTGEGSVKGEAWRVGVIYRTNAYTSYAAGRFAQLKADNFPLWVYRHGGSLEPRVQHLGWNGLVLPPDHEFWIARYPPSDWGCSCYVVGASSEAAAQLMGGDPSKQLRPGWDRIDPRTGLPIGIGRGWNYAPGRSVADAVNAMAAKYEKWPADIGAAFGAANYRNIDRSWTSWVDAVVKGDAHTPSLVGTLRPKDVAALTDAGIMPQSADLWVSPGLIKGPKARRHAAAGDKLSISEMRQLSRSLRSPQAVLLDTVSGRLIYLLPGGDGERLPQVAVAINFRLKANRQKVESNLVRSIYRPKLEDIRRRIIGGQLKLLSGVAE